MQQEETIPDGHLPIAKEETMKKYYFLTGLFLVVMLMVSASLSAQNYSGGSGTSDDPYQIANKADLKYLSENSDEWSKHFKQTADITFTSTDFQDGGDFYNGGAGFIPIGTDDGTPFTGSYNGDYYTIDGIYINRGSSNYIGVFGYLSVGPATVEKLGVTGVDITGNDKTGGLIGESYNSSVSNCYSTGSVSGNSAVGGLVGRSSRATVDHCYSTVSVSASDYHVGGLVGSNLGASGWNDVRVRNCYSTGSVNAGGSAVGGLVGTNESYATVSNSYSTGSVSGNGDVGGLVGYNSSTVSNCFWDTLTSGTNSIGGNNGGGTGKTTSEMKNLATFTDENTEGLDSAWDFVTNPNDDAANNDDWDMDLSGSRNNGYPYLFWENGDDVSLPVELTSFSAECKSGAVVLTWRTESETENLGFIFQRRREAGDRKQETVEWKQVADYTTCEALHGHGSTSEAHEYSYTDAAVVPGMTYEYRLGDVDYGGKVTWHKTVEITVPVSDAAVPAEFGLQRAFPNPFNPAVTLRYDLTKDAETTLKVYNMRGQLVEVLENTYKLKGTYDLVWQPHNLSAGVYIVQLQSGNQTNLQKIVFVK